MKSSSVDIRLPQNKDEWSQYYHLRWEILRKSWGKMAVALDQRKMGIGRLLVSSAKREASLKCASRLILDAREDAVDFYLKLGFKKIRASYVLFDSIQYYLMSEELSGKVMK